MEFQEELHRLRQHFQNLTRAQDLDDVPGLVEIASGLQKVSQHLHHQGATDPQRLTRLIETLDLLARTLSESSDEQNPEPENAPEKKTPAPGLEQFIGTFRNDADKRLSGLSISLMGVFGESGSEEALKQSASHLHAIRGGAAMLGLKDVAELARAMENYLISRQRQQPQERKWAAKTVLRGFALLQDAVASDPVALTAKDAEVVVQRLICDTLPLRNSGPRAEGVSRETPADEAATKNQAQNGAENKAENRPEREKRVEAAQKSAPPINPQSLEQPVLIVDDVETIAASIGFVLSELEVPIEVATHGEEAMRMLKEKPFSLVISDVDMPRMDGIALTRMIRSTPALEHLPVILLTSLDHPEERQDGMEAGATDYIIKGSIGGGDLVGRVRELLAVAPFVERDLEPDHQRILIAEDTETVAASIAFVLSEGPFEIVLASDGKDALKRLHKDPYDLLITDMQMPYMSGTELVTALRADEGLKNMPVIMLTSVQEEELVAQAQEAGVDRYLIKGEIAGGKLLAVVDEVLRNSKNGE